jgi:hypothetical protein
MLEHHPTYFSSYSNFRYPFFIITAFLSYLSVRIYWQEYTYFIVYKHQGWKNVQIMALHCDMTYLKEKGIHIRGRYIL